MTIIERSIYLATSAEAFSDYTGNLATWPDWVAGLSAVESEYEFVEPGATARMHMGMGGMEFTSEMEITEFVYPNRIVQQWDSGTAYGTNTWIITPEGDGITVSVTYDYDRPEGVELPADPAMIDQLNAQMLDQTLENLRAHLEG